MTLRTGCLAIADTAAGSGGVAGELEHPARFLATAALLCCVPALLMTSPAATLGAAGPPRCCNGGQGETLVPPHTCRSVSLSPSLSLSLLPETAQQVIHTHCERLSYNASYDVASTIQQALARGPHLGVHLRVRHAEQCVGAPRVRVPRGAAHAPPVRRRVVGARYIGRTS